MTLSIVIPAFNEETSIEQIIQRTLAARSAIIQQSDVDAVEITVVSDGSTDRTVELASRYRDQINLIMFEHNRGYGAAIKQGWKQSTGELLGFLDADGTCDPLFFVELCNLITREHADVALGSRLHRHSQMPASRRFGNILFATLLSVIASQAIKDTASGMRVVKRSALKKIMPLPNGLHFTPAMSARAILSNDLIIKELDMDYHEREGRSKLKAFQDGLRFLKIILQTAFLYRPNIFLTYLGIITAVAGGWLMAYPTYYYFIQRQVLEWMIYRFILTHLAAILSVLLLSVSYLTERMVNVTLLNGERTQEVSVLTRFFHSNVLWYCVVGCFLLGIWLIGHSLKERFFTGETYEHWSRYMAMATCFAIAFILVITRIIGFFLNLIQQRLNYLRSPTKDIFAYENSV